MPALPPLQALPQPLPPNALLMEASLSSDRSETTSQPHAPLTPVTPRPFAVSFSSTNSSATSKSASSGESSLFSNMESSTLSCPTTSPADCSPHLPTLSCDTTNSLSSETETAHVMKKPLYIVDSSAAESTSMGVAASQSLIPLDEIDKLSERSLAMQLYWSYQSVLGCQEAMYEELLDRTRNRTGQLTECGWDTDLELSELESRTKFEILVDRYER